MAEHRMITTLMRPFFRKGQATSFVLPGVVGNTSRILCIDSGDLSQMLFHIPLVTAIRRKFAGAHFDFLLTEKHADLVVPSGLARQCTIYKESQLSPWRPAFGTMLKKLGDHDYDMAMLMSQKASPRLELAALASGADLRFGPSHGDAWPAINFEIQPPEDENRYLGDRLLCAAPFLGLTIEGLDTRWPLPMDRIRQTAQQVHFHKPNPDQMLIGVDPGVGKTGHSFALENLQFLVRQLTSQLVCRVLPLGDPDSGSRIAALEKRLSSIPVGLKRDTLLDMALLLSQCDLFIAGNTDFFHMAVSLGVPTIGLFTSADKKYWIPRNRDRVRVVKVAKGEKVDIETLMEAVESVTDGRTSRPSQIISEDPTTDGDISQESGVDG